MARAENDRNERRVLMLGPTARDARLLERAVADAAIPVRACREAPELCREIKAGAAAVLLTEHAIGHSMDLVADCLGRQPNWSDLPVLLAIAGGTLTPGAVRAATRLGNVLLLDRPADVATLSSAVRTAVRARMRQYELREHQHELTDLIHQLSTPVLEVRRHVLLVPLIGAVDQQRATQMTQELLRAVRASRARVVVIDLTGVPGVDAVVANHLLLTMQACRLLGAKLILTGISTATAATLVELEIDWHAVTTAADLLTGLEEAEGLWTAAGSHAAPGAKGDAPANRDQPVSRDRDERQMKAR